MYPKICEAMKERGFLEVDFTGMHNLSDSFLEEAFGGLVRTKKLNPDEVLRTLKFLPEDSHFDLYIEIAKEYIEEAKPETS